MRMIAEILGCPFHLDILGDSLTAERTETAGAVIETIEWEEEQRTEAQTEETAEEGSGQTENPIEEGFETTEKQTEEVSKDRSEEETEEKDFKASETAAAEDSEISGTEGANEDKTVLMSHERDITIGELVDIHKELDAMIEKATGELPKLEEHLVEGTKEEQPAGIYGYDDSGHQTLERQEEMAENELVAEEGEPIEKLLEEIESMEKDGKKEESQEEKQETQAEKPHGWRAYFMQRFKKKGKDQPAQNEETHSEINTAEDEQTGKFTDNDSEEGTYAEENRMYGSYSESMYDERGYAEEGYPENEYDETGYVGNGYSDNRYPGNEYAESEYLEKSYVGMYAEDSRSVEYEENSYAETGYLQEAPKEEEEEKGERNPYTGKEYESNSVRMHPSRIGYVQVYDRSNHEWTDMTEWAFLGYQERKKQLLGKDYDPPIYLD